MQERLLYQTAFTINDSKTQVYSAFYNIAEIAPILFPHVISLEKIQENQYLEYCYGLIPFYTKQTKLYQKEIKDNEFSIHTNDKILKHFWIFSFEGDQVTRISITLFTGHQNQIVALLLKLLIALPLSLRFVKIKRNIREYFIKKGKAA